MRSGKLLEETQIVFEEQAQVLHAIAQHRQALGPLPNAKPIYRSGSSPMLRITFG